MSTNNFSQSRWAEHLRGCAELANEIAKIVDIREDSARQAMFATICIDAKGHGVFLEPIPPHSKTPVELNGDESLKGVPFAVITNKEIDAAAANKADAQKADVPRQSTPEADASARRTSLLSGINSARDLLVKEGYTPLFTPKYMNEFIKEKMNVEGNLGSLDVDELATLIELLNKTLDTFRHNKKAMNDEAPF